MKREPGDPVAAADTAFARQVALAAARLREQGVPPEHDLWPGISLALDAAAREAAGGRRARPAPALHRWPATALAASVLLAIGVGLSGWRGDPADTGGPQVQAPVPVSAAARPEAGADGARDGLRAVGAALDELQAALALAPDDPDLSRLVLMIHHSRGRLLRLQADSGVRETRRSPV